MVASFPQPTARTLGGVHLGLASIIVHDYDEAIRFFVDGLGFELVEDSPARTNDGRAKRWVVVRPPGAETGLLLARADGSQQVDAVGQQYGGRVGLFLHSADFASTYRRMLDYGIEFLETPRREPYGDVAVFRDVAGNKWDLLGPEPRSDELANVDSEATRVAFARSARWCAKVVQDIKPTDWSRPGLGEWTVRDLVGHLSLNCRYVLDLLDVDLTTEQRRGPFAFWNAALAGPKEVLDRSIAQAAPPAAESLGDDPPSTFQAIVDAGIDLVARSPDGRLVRSGGTNSLALIDYLPSRVVEFVAHGMELCLAIDRSAADVPEEALRCTASWLSSYADPPSLVRALLGRDGSRYSVF